MSQKELMAIIWQNPLISQAEIMKMLGLKGKGAVKQLWSLRVNWKQADRIYAGRRGWIWYATGK